jgi:hypothetical protein
MRRFVGVVVVAVVVSIALPAQARVFTDKESSWIDRAQTRISVLLKHFGMKSFGDLIAVPKP